MFSPHSLLIGPFTPSRLSPQTFRATRREWSSTAPLDNSHSCHHREKLPIGSPVSRAQSVQCSSQMYNGIVNMCFHASLLCLTKTDHSATMKMHILGLTKFLAVIDWLV